MAGTGSGRAGRQAQEVACGLLFTATFWLAGCASPGPPRAPSLHLPRQADDLAVNRSGDTVELRFTVPGLSTDGQPLREATIKGVVCRQETRGGPCRPVDTAATAALPVPGSGSAAPILVTDALPTPLLEGAPRPIAYRVELQNASGRSAGFSDPVYAAAGVAPAAVGALRAQGTRLGVELQWAAAASPGEVLLRREEATNAPTVASASAESPAPPPHGRKHGSHSARIVAKASKGSGLRAGAAASKGLVWLQADPEAAGVGTAPPPAMLDNSVQPGVPYRYLAIRRETVQVGGRSLVLESAPSHPVEVRWTDIYPPAPPTEVAALGFNTAAAEGGHTTGYAVDLIWQPVEDAQLAGYLVYRQRLTSEGEAAPGRGERLTPAPVATPGFHDATALPGARYRYSVTAIGTNGQESAGAEAVVEPALTP